MASNGSASGGGNNNYGYPLQPPSSTANCTANKNVSATGGRSKQQQANLSWNSLQTATVSSGEVHSNGCTNGPPSSSLANGDSHKNLRCLFGGVKPPSGQSSSVIGSRKRDNNAAPGASMQSIITMKDRLLQLSESKAQAKTLLRNLEKSGDSAATNEQIAHLSILIREMSLEEHDSIKTLNDMFCDQIPPAANVHKANSVSPREVLSSISSLTNGDVSDGSPQSHHAALFGGDCDEDSIMDGTLGEQSPEKLRELLFKLKESEEKLTTLQEEQGRLLSLQKRAETKLSEMSKMKRALEDESRSLETRRERADNLIVQSCQQQHQQPSTPSSAAHCLNDMTMRLRVLQDKFDEAVRPEGSTVVRSEGLYLQEEDDDIEDRDVLNPELDDHLTAAYVQELQKRQDLEYKLKELQKKKTRDDQLNETKLCQNQHAQRPVGRSSLVNVNNRPQHRYEADGSEEDEVRVRPSPPTNPQHPLRDQTQLNKYQELEKTEERLKQLENLMRLIEQHELQGPNDSSSVQRTSPQNISRKASNEELANSHLRTRALNPIAVQTTPTNSTRSGFFDRPLNTEAKRRAEVPRNMSEGNGMAESNGYATMSPLSSLASDQANQLNMIAAFANGNGAYSPSSASAVDGFANASSSAIKENFMKSLQSNFESMTAMFESQLNSTAASAAQSSPLGSNQVFYLMMMQNWQIMQQQQMLFYWLQQQQSSQTEASSSQAESRPVSNIRQTCSNCDQINGRFNFTASPLVETTSTPNAAHRTNQSSGIRVRPQHRSESSVPVVSTAALNNQVVPGMPGPSRMNNYWDNFKSNSRQNQLSTNESGSLSSAGFSASASGSSKSNDNLIANAFAFNSNFSVSSAGSGNGAAPNPTPNNELNANGGGSGFPLANSSVHTANYSSRAVRRPKKAANASQQTHDHGGEKIQNAPASSLGKGVDLTALYSVLEKFVNDESRSESGKVLKVKPNNLLPTDEEEGAVGGEGISSTNNEAAMVADQFQIMQRQSSQHTVPLHISPSTGAIRKKPRNQEIDSTTARQELINEDSLPVNETIRPLMAAEGRSSESRPGLVMAVPPSVIQQPPASNSSSSSHLLLKRPPTTGANGRDENEDSSSSSDDDLAEADQTAVEMSTAEAEPVHSTSNSSSSNINHHGHNAHISLAANQPDSSMPEDQGAIAAGRADGEEEEEEDNLSSTEANEDGIRLSGDGEQGL